MKKDYTLQEVFSTPKFDELFNKHLNELQQKRINIKFKRPDVQFKASPYSYLKDRDQLNADSMKNEVLLIIAKKSDLSAVYRDWIADFMREVVAKTLKALEPKKAKEKPFEGSKPSKGSKKAKK